MEYKTITEGSTKMCYPADEESAVFYNPVQVQNRDLSVLMTTLYSERRAIRMRLKEEKSRMKGVPDRAARLSELEQSLDPSSVVSELDSKTSGLVILDALAASGLRSIRYWKEIPGVKHVTINDLDAAAVERAHANLRENELTEVHVTDNTDRPYGICVNHGDATHEMYLSRRPQQLKPDAVSSKQLTRWDVIDLDPYGSVAPFLDAAIQAVEDGGMLNITCTDMAALGGSHPETCYGRYAAFPIQRAGYLQELALRILWYSIASTAAKYGRTVKPILSVGMDFYVRVFGEVYDDKAGVNDLSLKTGHVYQSKHCPSFKVVPTGQKGGKNGNGYQAGQPPSMCCEETGAPYKVAGPLWLGPLHDPAVIEEALKRLESKDTKPSLEWIATKDRLRGLLTTCSEELNDCPLFYRLPDLCQTLKVSAPSVKVVRAALENAGYRFSGYHKDPQAIKTDAPNRILWDILRAHYATHKPKKEPAPESAAAKILAKEPSIEVDFTSRGNQPKKLDVSRFPLNPERNWGPKKAASGIKRKAEEDAQKD